MRQEVEIVVYPQDWVRGETDCPVRDAVQRVLKVGYKASVSRTTVIIYHHPDKGKRHRLYDGLIPDEIMKIITKWDESRGGEYPLKEVRFTLGLPAEVLL